MFRSIEVLGRMSWLLSSHVLFADSFYQNPKLFHTRYQELQMELKNGRVALISIILNSPKTQPFLIIHLRLFQIQFYCPGNRKEGTYTMLQRGEKTHFGWKTVISHLNNNEN